MANRDYCCFRGRGKFALVGYDKRAKNTAGFEFVGNVLSSSMKVTEETEEVMDYTGPGGGVDCSASSITKVELEMEFSCFSPENLALALYGKGSSDNVVAGAFAATSLVAWPDTIVPLPKVGVSNLTVTNIAGTTTYALGVDYTVNGNNGAISIISAANGGTIPAPVVTAGVGQSNIKVAGSFPVQSLVQLMVTNGIEYALYFDGINTMNENAPVSYELFKVKASPADGVALISKTASSFKVKFTVLRDNTKSNGTTANPLSQYGTLALGL